MTLNGIKKMENPLMKNRNMILTAFVGLLAISVLALPVAAAGIKPGNILPDGQLSYQITHNTWKSAVREMEMSTSGEDCSGSYLNNAKDSFSCCSKPCSGTGTAGAVITIETPGPTQNYEDLGSISP